MLKDSLEGDPDLCWAVQERDVTDTCASELIPKRKIKMKKREKRLQNQKPSGNSKA